MAQELSRSYLYRELIEYRELVEFFFLSISPRVPDIQRNRNDVSQSVLLDSDRMNCFSKRSVTFLPLFPVLSFPAVFGLRAG